MVRRARVWRAWPALLLAASVGAVAADHQGELVGSQLCFDPKGTALEKLCLSYKVRWKAFSLMGEPVVNTVLVDWMPTDFVLRTRHGATLSMSQAPQSVREAANRLGLLWVGDAMVSPKPNIPTNVYLRLDSGTAARPGRPSYNVPGSPDWTQFLHRSDPLYGAMDKAAGQAEGLSCATGERRQWLPVADAKRLMRQKGFTLRNARFCDNLAEVHDVDALQAAVSAECEQRAQAPTSSDHPAWCAPLPKPKPKPVKEQPHGPSEAASAAAGCPRGGSVLDGDCASAAPREDPLDAQAARAAAAPAVGSATTPIQPSDSDGLARAVRVNGAQPALGQSPASSAGEGAPRIRATAARITTSNGSTVQIPFECQSTHALNRTLVQIEGANRHLRIPAPAGACNGRIAMSLPTNLEAGDFCVRYAVEDTQGRVSNYARTCLDTLKLGSGRLQISMAWDAGNSDVDLHVTVPGGSTIDFRNRGAAGGKLDRDNTSGFGPENVFWDADAPDGQYEVSVRAYAMRGRGRQIGYTVTLNAAGGNHVTRTGTLVRDKQKDVVLRFRKRGAAFEFD